MAAVKKKARRQPQRTCVGCREVKAKRELTRIVRLSDGHVVVDPTGKLPGRGAYICARRECWQRAVERRAIERALKSQIMIEDRAAMAAFFQELPSPAECDV